MKIRIAAFISSLALAAQADVIVSAGGWMNTTAAGIYVGSPAAYDQRQDVPVNGLNSTVTASYNGVSNTTSYDLAVAGSLGHFLVGMDHSAASMPGQYGEPHNQGQIFFNVTAAPVTYYLSGDWTSNFDFTRYNVQLAAGKSTIFNNTQASTGGAGSHFVLGGGSDVYGSLTGTLGIGSYVLTYQTVDQTTLEGTGSSDGFFRIDFGAPPPVSGAVPEPSTFALLFLGLAGLLARKRKA